MWPPTVGSQLRRAVTWAAVALLVGPGLLAACGDDKSDAQRAEDAAETLQKGLDAHVAGDLEEAEKRYKEVIEQDDQNAFAYYNLALVEQTTDRPEDAEADYRRALAINPEFTSALFNLAILRTAAGAGDEARSLYQQLLAIDPGNAGAHLNLGFLFRDQGQEDDAQREFAAAIAIDPTLQSRVADLTGAGTAGVSGETGDQGG